MHDHDWDDFRNANAGRQEPLARHLRWAPGDPDPRGWTDEDWAEADGR